MINKQIGTKLSALALALLLAGCGGGGSDGYYNNESSGSPSAPSDGSNQDETIISEKYFIEIDSTKPKIDLNGDEFEVSLRLVDALGGGVAGKEVNLELDKVVRDQGLINTEISKKTTDVNGYAKFKLSFKNAESADLRESLINNGLKISGSYIDENKEKAIEPYTVQFIANEADGSLPTYNLTMSANKKLLSIKGASTIVTVQAVDNQDTVVTGKSIVLSVFEPKNTGILIAKNTIITDELGLANFDVTIPTNLNDSQKETLIQSGLTLKAQITDDKGRISYQTLPLKITDAQGTEATPNMTFGRTAKLTSDNMNYAEKMSVRVVDKDGTPIYGKAFNVSLEVINRKSGYYIFSSTDYKGKLEEDKFDLTSKIDELKAKQDELKAKEVELKAEISKLENITPIDQTQLDETKEKLDETKEKLDEVIQDIKLNEKRNVRLNSFVLENRYQIECPMSGAASDLATEISGTNIQPKLGGGYIATTDSSGQFNFDIKYFKRYATWQTVRIKIEDTENPSSGLNITYDYKLGALKADLDSTATEPFDTSPYYVKDQQCGSPVEPWKYIFN